VIHPDPVVLFYRAKRACNATQQLLTRPALPWLRFPSETLLELIIPPPPPLLHDTLVVDLGACVLQPQFGLPSAITLYRAGVRLRPCDDCWAGQGRAVRSRAGYLPSRKGTLDMQGKTSPGAVELQAEPGLDEETRRARSRRDTSTSRAGPRWTNKESQVQARYIYKQSRAQTNK
jgi:hypothetical protein